MGKGIYYESPSFHSRDGHPAVSAGIMVRFTMKALAFIAGMAIRPLYAESMVRFTVKALAFIAGMAIRPFHAGIMVWFTVLRLTHKDNMTV